jgi:hypothetical protein
MKKRFIYLGQRRLASITIAGCALSISGCLSTGSMEAYAEKRRQTLLEMYPVGKTTQKDVETRWGEQSRRISATRPAKGWDTHDNPRVKRFGPKAEKRIGKKIAKLEQYHGPDGLMSLCYCWYYYDNAGRLVDTEWEWSSD